MAINTRATNTPAPASTPQAEQHTPNNVPRQPLQFTQNRQRSYGPAGPVPQQHVAPHQQHSPQQGTQQQVPRQQMPPLQQMPIQQLQLQQLPLQQMPVQQMPVQQMPLQQMPLQHVSLQHITPLHDADMLNSGDENFAPPPSPTLDYSPEPQEEPIEEVISNTRARLFEETFAFYLGIPALVRKVEFTRNNLQKVLVRRDNPRVKAIFSIIARVNIENFYIHPYGRWTPNNDRRHSLSGIRLSCALIPIEHGPVFTDLRGDLRHILANLQAIDSLAPPREEATERSTALTITNYGTLTASYSWKVGHKLFVSKERLAHFPANHPGKILDIPLRHAIDLVGLARETKFEDWPMPPMLPAEDLARLKAEYAINPFPAFGKDGNLVPPTQYTTLLPGCIVQAYISVSHYEIGNRSTTSYDVEEMNILEDGEPQLINPLEERAMERGKGRQIHPDAGKKRKLGA